ncbi:MAG: branched-chain amino acid ABC transporter permease [Pseudomonadota bacterium]
MEELIVFVVTLAYAMANLALIALGLAIVFGMMRVINLAHGEFLMLGGYAVVLSINNGINIWLAMLVIAPLTVGAIGILVERLLIRFLYGRMIDTLLATWGLSLLIIGLITVIFGPQTPSGALTAPIGSVQVGARSISGYELFLIAMTLGSLALVYGVLRYTKLGLLARGTMQRPDMAAALGVSTSRIYMATFGFGSAMAGLAGGLLAPIVGVLPTIGAAYVAKAFITVISGGAAILAGTGSAAVLLGGVENIVTQLTGPTMGAVALLLAAVVIIRLLPQGITGRFFRRSL